ncbi:MAG: ATP-binding protein [Alphaproteobacteria bacterium]
MTWLQRLWPKRLAGQMIALLLLALVLAQVITVMIFADERRFAILAVDRSQMLGRAASVARLLENAPPSLHEQILATAGERRMRYWLSKDSAVGEQEEDHDETVPAWLAERWSGRFDRPVRLILGDDDDRTDGWWRGDDGEDDGSRRRRRPHGHAPTVLLSMQLHDGAWLNMESRLPPPAFPWKLPALTWLGIMGLVISIVVIVMVRRITRPMAALATAAERAGRGEAIEPLPEVGPLDVRQTTSAFNRMHGRLQRFIRDRTQMLAAMSHDLRTPITTLRLRAEFIEDEEIKQKILETLEEMQRMAEATLAFVREEAAVEPTRKVDLTALVQSVADDLIDLGWNVQVEDSGRVDCTCRPAALKRALRNLLENAIRYGERAKVSLATAPSAFSIVIDDDGPGIPEEQIERMFQPFVRLDESRSVEGGGIGLGLAIARSIIRNHGGDITLSNREAGGLRATITLPRGR